MAIICVTLITFRSVLIPIKAVVMNALLLGATYGILVLVFQKGFGTGFLGFDKTGELQNFVPVLLLALLFSLSTDDEVFLSQPGAEGTWPRLTIPTLWPTAPPTPHV